ncbi:MAG: acetate--CoA ligase family protein [Deltaproteobacteria bacterium]|nr:acetate--CoA ligase family protein [Deltaproteobacteria bacterium]
MEPLLLGVDALSLLQQEGFPILKSLLARNEDDAARKALEIGLPVTLKPSSPDVIHKTETGAIRASLRDEAEVRQGFREIVGTFTSNYPEKRLDGVLVQRQGSGLEVIVGMLRDQQFGPVLMFGLGGVFVEAMKDVTFRLIPIETADANDMMEELKGYDVLRNPRSGTIDLPAVENLLVDISTFIAHHPEVQEMDLNPVFVSSHGVQICDARIKVHSNEGNVKE